MNPFVLLGFGSSLSVEKRCLIVSEGRGRFWPYTFTRFGTTGRSRKPKVLKFRPRQLPYDSILIEGSSGFITFAAIRWLMHYNVPLFMFDYGGSLLSATMPPGPVHGDPRRAQMEAHLEPERRLRIARSFVEAKLLGSLAVLDWLRESHDIEGEIRSFKGEASGLRHAKTVNEVRGVEAHCAEFYWRIFQKRVPSKLEFKGRSVGARSRRARNASDPVNALLNYGYTFLQACVRRSVNMAGLDASVGFLHESLKPGTAPLIYDFEEPYRWLVDCVVLRMVLSEAFSWDDFHFAGGTYRLRIHPRLLDRYAQLLRRQFNSGIVYEGRRLFWDTLILRKCQELTRYLLGRRGSFDLTPPRPVLQRSDTRQLREKILGLSQSEARKRGIGKSTLHYLHENASDSTRSFRVYSKVRKRLMPQSTREARRG